MGAWAVALEALFQVLSLLIQEVVSHMAWLPKVEISSVPLQQPELPSRWEQVLLSMEALLLL